MTAQSTQATDAPVDATARYQNYSGQTIWLKDLDESKPSYVMARLWSVPHKRWRNKRERVNLLRVLALGKPLV